MKKLILFLNLKLYCILLFIFISGLLIASTLNYDIASFLVEIPAGSFEMGDRNNLGGSEHNNDEVPIHLVELDSFNIGRFEITNNQYAAFLNSVFDDDLIYIKNGLVIGKGNDKIYCDTYSSDSTSRITLEENAFIVDENRGNHPVTHIRWEGAAAFCNWLSKADGYKEIYNLETGICDFHAAGYRLPTEAEWEYAANGGTNEYFVYPYGDEIDFSKANLPDSGDPFEKGDLPLTTPVGFYNGNLQDKTTFNWPGKEESYQTTDGMNPFGLYDLSGNVWEWCNDLYGRDYYQKSSLKNPIGPETGSPMPDKLEYHVLRGGSWYNGFDGHSRTSNRNPAYYRGPDDPNHSWYHIGFRIVFSNGFNSLLDESETNLSSNSEAPKAEKRSDISFSDSGQISNFTSLPGEDSDYSINPPAFISNSDGTVSDLNTGLMWQKKDGGEMSWEEAKVYAENLSLDNYNDWRLPTAKELFSINDFEKLNPALDLNFFTKTKAQYWWSINEFFQDSNRIWVTNSGGGIGPHPKKETISSGGDKRFHVRCVRDIPNNEENFESLKFSDNFNDTVTDTTTGLIWQKTSQKKMSWEDALIYCNSLKLAGYDDWRLPNIKELWSIINIDSDDSVINEEYFLKTYPSEYWSSTSQINQSENAWFTDFKSGVVSYDDKSEMFYVRAVR